MAGRWLRHGALVALLPLASGLMMLAEPASAAHLPAYASAPPVSYVQGGAFSEANPGHNGTCEVDPVLWQPVAAGDLLVIWAGAYEQPAGSLTVSDSVNGVWTQAPGSLTFSNGSGEIALYYVISKVSSNDPLPIAVSTENPYRGPCSSPDVISGTLAEYRGIATSDPLDQVELASGYGTSVRTPTTGAVPAGELVFSAEVSGAFEANPPQPASSGGVAFTARASQYGSAYDEDITSSASGTQQGAADWPTGSPNTDWYAVVATFRNPSTPPPPPPSPRFVQGGAVGSGSRVASTTVGFGQPVAAGDLLVGWFAQYDATGPVSVSDPVNGAWTRGPGPADLPFSSGTGDIALYYVTSHAAASGLTITVSAPEPTYLEGSAADYANVATTSPLDQFSYGNSDSQQATSNLTKPTPAGELVYGALVTGGGPQGVTPGAGFTARASTPSGAAFEEDLTASAAGIPKATATLGFPTDWYMVAATFRPAG